MAATRPDDVGNEEASIAEILSRYEQERRDLLRQVDLLTLEVSRLSKLNDEASGRVAMLKLAMDRHLAHCERDEAAVQRLMAELQEANARRKEQVAIILRREARIQSLLDGKTR